MVQEGVDNGRWFKEVGVLHALSRGIEVEDKPHVGSAHKKN